MDSGSRKKILPKLCRMPKLRRLRYIFITYRYSTVLGWTFQTETYFLETTEMGIKAFIKNLLC